MCCDRDCMWSTPSPRRSVPCTKSLRGCEAVMQIASSFLYEVVKPSVIYSPVQICCICTPLCVWSHCTERTAHAPSPFLLQDNNTNGCLPLWCFRLTQQEKEGNFKHGNCCRHVGNWHRPSWTAVWLNWRGALFSLLLRCAILLSVARD